MFKRLIQIICSNKANNIDNEKFERDKHEYIKQTGNGNLFRYEQSNEYKILSDYKESAGSIDSHYFFQDIFVANYIIRNNFKHIYDIGSRIDGYIAHLLAAEIKVTMIDIRPLPIKVENLEFLQANATELSGIQDNSIPIITSLHALEHFGLGRYGDPVDYNGWKKALHAIVKKVSYGGTLILSVPCGNENKLMFNAHRIFHPMTVFSEVSDCMKLCLFARLHESVIDQFVFDGEKDAQTKLTEISKTLGTYDCGIFIFNKKAKS